MPKPQKNKAAAPGNRRGGTACPDAAGAAPAGDLAAITAPLLAWYHANRRILPFREDPAPYHVWVSEIMLQQTQVATALPYYTRFIAALPGVAALAACGEEELHKLWEGLGYYSRVRNMQKAARLVMERHGGQLPADYDALLALPGIGEYTAGAIASIAFGLPALAVDGNVLRVAARLLASSADVALPATKKRLSAAVATALPQSAPGDFNQALMELGALVCTPKSPACAGCPLAQLCRANQTGQAAALPVKAKAKPKREEEYTLLIVQSDGRVLLQQRPQSGLLAGLWQPPMLPGHLNRQQAQSALQQLAPGAKIIKALPDARHIFTHRTWQMRAWLCEAKNNAPAPEGHQFATAQQLQAAYTLPGAFKAYLPWLRP